VAEGAKRSRRPSDCNGGSGRTSYLDLALAEAFRHVYRARVVTFERQFSVPEEDDKPAPDLSCLSP